MMPSQTFPGPGQVFLTEFSFIALCWTTIFLSGTLEGLVLLEPVIEHFQRICRMTIAFTLVHLTVYTKRLGRLRTARKSGWSILDLIEEAILCLGPPLPEINTQYLDHSFTNDQTSNDKSPARVYLVTSELSLSERSALNPIFRAMDSTIFPPHLRLWSQHWALEIRDSYFELHRVDGSDEVEMSHIQEVSKLKRAITSKFPIGITRLSNNSILSIGK